MKNKDSISERMKELAEQDDLIPEETANVVPFKLITGGKEPPTDTGFWLLDLEVGTVFLARSKPTGQNMTRSIDLTEYGIFNKATDGAVMLFVVQPGQTTPVWVDGKAFSNGLEKFTVLRTNDARIMDGRKKAGYDGGVLPEENNDGTDFRTVQPD